MFEKLSAALARDRIARKLAEGQILIDYGHLREAISLYTNLASYSKRTLGLRNPTTTDCLKGAARAYEACGNYKNSISLRGAVLSILEDSQGPDEVATLSARRDLGRALLNAAIPERAVPVLERVVRDNARLLAVTHPLRLQCQDSLGEAYSESKDGVKAVELLKTTLRDYELSLGPKGPLTTQCRTHLGSAYRVLGEYDRAVSTLTQALNEFIEAVGPDHVDTLLCRSRLALTHVSARYPDALELVTRTHAAFERAFGADDYRTLNEATHLATARQQAGDREGVITLLEATLALSEQALGRTHPRTWMVRDKLAASYRSFNRPELAVELLDRCCASLESSPVGDPVQQLQGRMRLTQALMHAGDLARCLDESQRLLEDTERILGRTDSGTITARSNLAMVHLNLDHPHEAIGLLEDALVDSTSALGASDRLTLRIIECLEKARASVAQDSSNS